MTSSWPKAPAAPAPEWDLVPFDVACARCGHDLRGLSVPKCSGCGLEFDWSEVVPIEHLRCLHCGYHLCGLKENRCPECGQKFDPTRPPDPMAPPLRPIAGWHVVIRVLVPVVGYWVILARTPTLEELIFMFLVASVISPILAQIRGARPGSRSSSLPAGPVVEGQPILTPGGPQRGEARRPWYPAAPWDG